MRKQSTAPKQRHYPFRLGALRSRLVPAIPYLASVTALWCIAMICGIFVARAAGETFCKPCPYLLLKIGEYSYFGTFFLYVGAFGLLTAACFTGIFHPLFSLIAAGVCAYWGYRFGLNSVGCCNADVMGGIVSIVVFYLPLNVTALCCAWGSFALHLPFRLRGKALQTCPQILRRSLMEHLILWGLCCCVTLIVAVVLPLFIRLIFL